MSDRELLKAAARAAGHTLGQHTQKYHAVTLGGAEWNPLADDGDALRLAVKLGIQVCWHASLGYATAHYDYGSSKREEYGLDPYAATRRAIVRAAAALADR